MFTHEMSENPIRTLWFDLKASVQVSEPSPVFQKGCEILRFNGIEHRCVDSFDPELVASALNRANAVMYVREFGQMPRRRPGPVLEVISRLWISSLYGERWVAKRSSTLQRK